LTRLKKYALLLKPIQERSLTMLKRKEKKEVIFQPKSLWQKYDCINRSAKYDCQNQSVLEAVCGNARVRCCENPKCKKVATELAMDANI